MVSIWLSSLTLNVETVAGLGLTLLTACVFPRVRLIWAEARFVVSSNLTFVDVHQYQGMVEDQA